MTIQQDLQKPALPAYIDLYVLDLTPRGGSVLYFTDATVNGSTSVSFGGQVYTALPITGNGWETSIDGAAPQPTLKVSNVSRFIQSHLTSYKDLVGCKVTRRQTFDKYLDGGSSPDSTQTFNTCVYIISQKLRQNKLEIEFRLRSVIDAPQYRLPRRQVLRSGGFPGAGLYRK
jgi:lambda family phage minor tail protein L